MKFRKLQFFAAAILLTLFTGAALADQAAYITKEQADKAVAFLKDKAEIRHYCAPCSDKGDRVEKITTVEAVKVDYQHYWEVRVNGKGVDLAYIYYRPDGDDDWKNVAKKLKIKVKDVPKKLDDDDDDGDDDDKGKDSDGR